MLNAFAPPFRLVGGYFFVGLVSLFLGLFGFLQIDASAILAPKSAAVIHAFLVGFVISVILGALYQLSSVIVERAFFTIKFAFANLGIYAFSLFSFILALFCENFTLSAIFGGILFASLLYFGTSFFLTIFLSKKRDFIALCLQISSAFFIIGISLGFLLVLVLFGAISLDFSLLLKLHIYFVLGFVFFVVLGATNVLLPMFGLAHGLNQILSKFAFGFYILAGICLKEPKFSAILAGISVIFFVLEALKILYFRARKRFDYWNLNIIFAAFCAIFAIICAGSKNYENALFLGFYGFFYSFIAAHIYKIVPFLVWYHFVSPFIGRLELPKMEDMVLKLPAYLALVFCGIACVAWLCGWRNLGILCEQISVIFLIINFANFMKFTRFGDGRANLRAVA